MNQYTINAQYYSVQTDFWCFRHPTVNDCHLKCPHLCYWKKIQVNNFTRLAILFHLSYKSRDELCVHMRVCVAPIMCSKRCKIGQACTTKQPGHPFQHAGDSLINSPLEIFTQQ